MDTTKLRSHVFEQTGIRIDTTDPVFALVALNDAVLAEGVERQKVLIDEMAERLASSVDELVEAGERFKRQAQRTTGRGENASADEPAALPTRKLRLAIAGLAGVTILLTSLITIIGVNALHRHDPLPAAGAPLMSADPLPLTAEQILNMQNGERFVKILPKLDAKTQARILELMRQP